MTAATDPVPEQEHQRSASSGQDSLVAEPPTDGAEGSNPTGDEGRNPVQDDDGQAPTDPFALLNGRVGGGVLAVISFWLIALCVPDASVQIGGTVTIVVAVAIALLAVAAFWVLFPKKANDTSAASTSSQNSPELAGALSLGLFLVLVDALWIVSATRLVTVDGGLRFAVGVGGSALAALAIGLLMFRNIRVAASLPTVVLFIGVAAFPQGQALTGSLGGTLIAWMASIIGVSAVAESATQITSTIQRGKVARSVVDSEPTISAGKARMLQEAVFPRAEPRSE